MSKLRAIQLFGLTLLLCGFSIAVRAQGRWEYLGEANVDGAVDHDRITVSARRGEFRAIRIRVERGPIEFDRVVVHFRDGESDPIAIRSRIRAGGQTRVIDLPGRERIIQSVEFWYARANWHERKPKVRLFGLH